MKTCTTKSTASHIFRTKIREIGVHCDGYRLHDMWNEPIAAGICTKAYLSTAFVLAVGEVGHKRKIYKANVFTRKRASVRALVSKHTDSMRK